MSSNGSMAAAPPFFLRSRTHARCCASPITVTSWRTAASSPEARAKRCWRMTAFNVPILECPSHENHRRALALGHRTRLPVADPGRARAAEDDLEFEGQLSYRDRDGAVFPRQWRAGHSRFRLLQIPADGRNAG